MTGGGGVKKKLGQPRVTLSISAIGGGGKEGRW